MNWQGFPETGAEVRGLQVKGLPEEKFRLEHRKLRYATITRTYVLHGRFHDVDFSHSRFIDCQFRHTEFRKCIFTEAFFKDCDLPHTTFIECKLPYSRWKNTKVDIGQLVNNLPSEWPNVAHALCQNLRANCRGLGDGPAARRLLFKAMAFRRSTLKEILLLRKSWYQERYKWADRLGAAVRLAGSWVARWGWGYGESPSLLLGWAAVAILSFSGYYYIQGFADSLVIGGDRLEQYLRALQFSALSFVGSAERASWPEGPTAAVVIEGTLGLLFIGVFAAALYRWISIRQG